MSGWATLWLRFDCDLVEPGIPDGFLDFLAAFATSQGLVVREETVASSPTVSAYRSAPVATRVLHLQVPKKLYPRYRRWRSVRVWQEGSTVRLRGTLPGTGAAAAAAVTWPLWMAARGLRGSYWELVLLLLIPTLVILVSSASLRSARMYAKTSMTELLAAALREQRALEPALPAKPPAATSLAPATVPSEPRLRVADPALAATVRETHADRADHDREAPEDLVAELERRGGGET